MEELYYPEKVYEFLSFFEKYELDYELYENLKINLKVYLKRRIYEFLKEIGINPPHSRKIYIFKGPIELSYVRDYSCKGSLVDVTVQTKIWGDYEIKECKKYQVCWDGSRTESCNVIMRRGFIYYKSKGYTGDRDENEETLYIVLTPKEAERFKEFIEKLKEEVKKINIFEKREASKKYKEIIMKKIRKNDYEIDCGPSIYIKILETLNEIKSKDVKIFFYPWLDMYEIEDLNFVFSEQGSLKFIC